MPDQSSRVYYLQGSGKWRKGAPNGPGALSLKAVLRQGGQIEGGK